LTSIYTIEVNGGQKLFGYPHSLKHHLLCSTDNLTQVWNNLRVSKWSQNFPFWVSYPCCQHACSLQC